MSVYNRSNQGGAIATFVIFAVVMTVVVIAGVYFVQQRGETARRDTAIAVAEAQGDANNTPPQKEAVTSDVPVSTEDPVSNEQAAATSPSATALPTTGPTDNIVHVIMIAGLAFIITRYVQSRRQAIGL